MKLKIIKDYSERFLYISLHIQVNDGYYYFLDIFLYWLFYNSMCIDSWLISCSFLSIASIWNRRKHYEASAIKYMLSTFKIIFSFNVFNVKSTFCISLVCFACHKTTRTHFSLEDIAFHMIVCWAHRDQVSKCNYIKTKWVRKAFTRKKQTIFGGFLVKASLRYSGTTRITNNIWRKKSYTHMITIFSIRE